MLSLKLYQATVSLFFYVEKNQSYVFLLFVGTIEDRLQLLSDVTNKWIYFVSVGSEKYLKIKKNENLKLLLAKIKSKKQNFSKQMTKKLLNEKSKNISNKF